jgi:methylmalonyl-CoA mutase N-terminal domain/subunit
VADVIDPLGGSYYVENLTDEVEKAAQTYLNRIESLGGALTAIETGFLTREIQESSFRQQRELETGKRVVVGVNRFQAPSEPLRGLLRVDPAVGQRQAEMLACLRRERDNARVSALLRDLDAAARSTDNLMPPILACVEEYATLGEVCGVLRGVFGEAQASVAF